MINALFSMTVKPERLEEFPQLARQEAAATRAEDTGCLRYTFLQQADAPCEFVLYEQRRDQAALDAHLARLDRTIGLRALFDFFEKTQSDRYNVVA